MKWGMVYMGVFMAFWGIGASPIIFITEKYIKEKLCLAYIQNPINQRDTMDKHYSVKWQGKEA